MSLNALIELDGISADVYNVARGMQRQGQGLHRTMRDMEEEPQRKWEHQERDAPKDFTNPHCGHLVLVVGDGLMFPSTIL